MNRSESFQLQKTQSYEYFLSQESESNPDPSSKSNPDPSSKSNPDPSSKSLETETNPKSIEPVIITMTDSDSNSAKSKDSQLKRTYSQTETKEKPNQKLDELIIDIICKESTIDKFINDYDSVISTQYIQNNNSYKYDVSLLSSKNGSMHPPLKKQKTYHDCPNIESIQMTYDDKYRQMCDILKVVCKYKAWTLLKSNGKTDMINGVTIGDIINITYIPQSQKYIEYYEQENFSGKVIFIDVVNDNMFLLAKINGVDTVKSLERESCHYLGMARGYSFNINKS